MMSSAGTITGCFIISPSAPSAERQAVQGPRLVRSRSLRRAKTNLDHPLGQSKTGIYPHILFDRLQHGPATLTERYCRGGIGAAGGAISAGGGAGNGATPRRPLTPPGCRPRRDWRADDRAATGGATAAWIARKQGNPQAVSFRHASRQCAAHLRPAASTGFHVPGLIAPIARKQTKDEALKRGGSSAPKGRMPA
jgi:hypothetical protein